MLPHQLPPRRDPFTPAGYGPAFGAAPIPYTPVCRICYADLAADRAPDRMCRNCGNRRHRAWLAAGAAVSIVSIGFTVFALVKPGKRKDKPVADDAAPLAAPVALPAENDPSDLETSAIDSCDAGKIRRLLEAYNQEDKFAASVRAGEKYQRTCKRSPLLDWDLLYAHEQLEQWEPAERVADRLLRENPTDNDYWWWRGKTRAKTGQDASAVVDIRQSLVDADEKNNGVQVNYLPAPAKATKQPCESAFALRWLANAGVELNSSAEREMVAAYLDGKCMRLDGKGTFAWKSSGRKLAKRDGKLAGKRAALLVDNKLGTTLVRRSVADTLGLADGETVDVLTPTGLGTGTTSTANITVGGATAADVPVVIVDELPDGYDAVIGLSFLWRFEVDSDDDVTFVAKPPETVID